MLDRHFAPSAEILPRRRRSSPLAPRGSSEGPLGPRAAPSAPQASGAHKDENHCDRRRRSDPHVSRYLSAPAVKAAAEGGGGGWGGGRGGRATIVVIHTRTYKLTHSLTHTPPNTHSHARTNTARHTHTDPRPGRYSGETLAFPDLQLAGPDVGFPVVPRRTSPSDRTLDGRRALPPFGAFVCDRTN